MTDAEKETTTLAKEELLEGVREAPTKPAWDEGTFGHLKLGPIEWAEFMLQTEMTEKTRKLLRRERQAWLGKKKRGARGDKHYKVRRKKVRERQRRLRFERGSDEQTIGALYKRCCRNWRAKGSTEWMSEREFEELARRVPLVDGDPFWVAKGRRVWFRRKDPSLGFVRENIEVLLDRQVVDLL